MSQVDAQYYDKEDAGLNSKADKTALAIAEQGIVLMKNDNGTLPLAKKSKVTPFGYRYTNPIYGGTGSGSVNVKSSRIYTAQRALHEYFDTNKDVEHAMTSATARGMDSKGYQKPDEKTGFEGATDKIIEYNPDIYKGHEDSATATTGIVFIGRSGGEGSDVAANVPGSPIAGKGYFDGTPHQLALSNDEKETIKFAKAHCKKLVVVLDSSNVMEIGDLLDQGSAISADAVLWVGGPGAQGFKAMAEILSGEINPSGKTVDTWMTDTMSDPSMANFGNAQYKDLYLLQGGYPTPVGKPTPMDFIEYEENIYVGYRYYETVHDTGGSFTVKGKENQNYARAVQLPFGFGLSYTDFSQRLVSSHQDGDKMKLSVEVTNEGKRAGRDVVQAYYHPPYTDFDAQQGIEKSTVNLIAYEKTDDIQPGASQTIDLAIDAEDLASYDYQRQNPDGSKGSYLLEAGDYAISVNRDSHEQYGSANLNVPSTVWYDSTHMRTSDKDAQSKLDNKGKPTGKSLDGKAFKAPSNLFQSLSDHMVKTSQLTRSKGPLTNTASFPTKEEKADFKHEGFNYTTDDKGKMTLQQADVNTDKLLGNVKGSKVYTTQAPRTKASNGLTLSDMRGASYDDPRWEKLLDQLDLKDSSLYVALAASYDQTAQISSISKPATVDFDGPQGIVGSITDAKEYTAYPTEPIIAATFNKNLVHDMGDMVGQEAASAGVNSWYAPAANIHRAPFSGRNFEYFSEDPVLSGAMLTSEVSGAASRGLIATIKHFAINDQEMYNNDRSRVATWVNEQAMREVYLKPFEMAIKNARMEIKYTDSNKHKATKVMRGTTGVMNSMNYIGATWAGASYALNTELLRDEWGFRGLEISDMVMNAGSNSVDQALRSGTDSWMAWGTAFTSLIKDKSSPTGVSVIRRAVKNMSYAIVNSHTMNGLAPGTEITYRTSPWKIWLAGADALVLVFALAMAVVMVRRTKDSRLHPDRYKPRKKKGDTVTVDSGNEELIGEVHEE
ncbi:glycoside hydrolase family 3 protein [Bifidobacterium aemilianum]|nr:glycoside hydrolase family 3 protein [Bifidobacterium aemilianum]